MSTIYSPIPAEGSVLGYSLTLPAVTYVSVANITSLHPNATEVESVETTNLGSAAKTFRPGLIPDNGEVEVGFFFDPNDTNQQALRVLANTPAQAGFKITYHDGHGTAANDVFTGFVTKFDPGEAEENANFPCKVTIKVSGAVTSAAGTG